MTAATGHPPEPPLLTIGRRDFEAIRRGSRFARRPYACLVLRREGYPVYDDLTTALEGLGLRTFPVPVGRAQTKGAFLEQLVQTIVAVRPDFVLTLSHTGVDQEGTLVSILADLRLPLASWLLDSPDLILAPYPEAVSDQVVIFSCDAGALAAIRRAGYRHVHYLPLAAAPGLLAGPGPDGPGLAWPVSFIGEDYVAETGRRLRAGHFDRALLGCLKPLAKRLIAGPTRDLASLFSPDEASLLARYLDLSPARRRQDFELALLCRANTLYRAAVLSRLLPLGPLVVGPPTWKSLLRAGEDWHWRPSVYDPAVVAALYRTATVNMNITSIHMHGAQNQRLFDVPAAGGFLLTDWSPQLEGLFDPGSEVATYAGPTDARQQCERYRQDATARASIIQAARRRIEHEHTFGHRVASLLHTLKAMR